MTTPAPTPSPSTQQIGLVPCHPIDSGSKMIETSVLYDPKKWPACGPFVVEKVVKSAEKPENDLKIEIES